MSTSGNSSCGILPCRNNDCGMVGMLVQAEDGIIRHGVLRLRSAGASLRSDCVTLLIFSTPVMLSGSAAQAAVESKHPCLPAMPQPATHFRPQPVAKRCREKARETTSAAIVYGSFDSIRLAPHSAQDDSGEKVTHSQHDRATCVQEQKPIPDLSPTTQQTIRVTSNTRYLTPNT
jgi:hypothetical protein